MTLSACTREREGVTDFSDCREIINLQPDNFQKYYKTFTCQYVRRASGKIVSSTCVHVDAYSGGLLGSSNGKCETAYIYTSEAGPDTRCTKEYPYEGANGCYTTWEAADLSFKTAPAPAPVPSPTPVATLLYRANNTIMLDSTRLSEFKKFAGKYPYELNLFEIPEIKMSAEKVFGNELDHFKKNLEVQVPIALTSDCLVIEGCVAHMCDDDNAIFVIDLVSGRIHGAIYENHLSQGGTQNLYVYSDVQKASQLPQVLVKWMDKKGFSL